LQSEPSIQQARINKLEKESSASHNIIGRLEATTRNSSYRQRTVSCKARLHDTRQTNTAQDEVLTKLREDKQALASELEEQSQAINVVQLNW
jgi:hypothetical protein